MKSYQTLSRRDFFAMSASMWLAWKFGSPKMAHAAATDPVLVNVILEGGPDFRHLFVPYIDTSNGSLGHAYWVNRARSHGISPTDTNTWVERFASAYTPMEVSGHKFGILNKAGWLKEQIDKGNVAIINNVRHAINRDHAHSLLIYQTGNLHTGAHDLDAHGWGGKLATAMDTNILSLTPRLQIFCNGAGAYNNNVVTVSNSRNFGLYRDPRLDDDPDNRGDRAIMTRALEGYYQQKNIESSSIFYKPLAHDRKLRQLSRAVRDRLEDIPLPEAMEKLSKSGGLNLSYFGKQVSNLYDSMQVADLLNFRIVSMEYTLWDTHRNHMDPNRGIEPRLEDLFAEGKAFDSLNSSLSEGDRARMVYMFGGEFGRQFQANGDGGTDHGRSNAIILVGEQVKGGIYGDFFPSKDAKMDAFNTFGGIEDIDITELFNTKNRDTIGLTSFEQVFGRVCDFMGGPNTGSLVFPNLNISDSSDANYPILEAGLSMQNLFA